MNEINNPARTHNPHHDVLVFRSNAAVGLIVSTNEAEPKFIGAFLSPAEAREIAENLIASADLAEQTRTMSREEFDAWVAQHMTLAA